MARGTTLANLRTYVKSELRDAQETNSTYDAELNYAIARKQSDLAFAYDWPFLKHRWDLSCPQGSRFLNIPTVDSRGQTAAINFERPVWVERFFNSRWLEVGYGITAEQLNARNSDLNQVLDPIQRWQLVSNSVGDPNVDQIEIWPITASLQTLRFTGQRIIGALAADTDKADLDDFLLVYGIAADYLALRGQENAPLVLKKFTDRLAKLRQSYPEDSKAIILGRRSTYERDHFRITPLVVVSGSP